MKRKIYYLSSLLFFLVIAFSFIKAQQEEAKGKILFKESKCISCHAIESQGFMKKGKSSAPDLSNVGNQQKPEWLEKYITKQESLNDLKHPVSFKGNDEDLKVLVQWLSTLKKEPSEKTTK